jgi:hypothetical protein
MKFHFPSFVIGYAAGAATAALAPKIKPIVLELAAAGYRIADAIAVVAARKREDLADLLAEARARAGRVARPATRPS